MTINATNGLSRDLYWQDDNKVPDRNNGALTQADFFALLTQQLAFQDPTKPVENDQMIAQMTNFTMADGISSLNTNFKSFAESMSSNQALQASSLVGRSVLVPSSEMVFTGQDLSRGIIDFEQRATNVRVRIEKPNGELVQTITIPEVAAGKFDFVWDGTNSKDQDMPPGVYKIKVDANMGGENQSVPVMVYAPVSSVSLGQSGKGITLNLVGLGAFKLADVREISYG
ncbi:flagellar hook assembly protein FlgD [Alkalimonas amylolytica]|uniref:Basal-body rod modification protein FlgD n=1 Tax=Alkalimonas amylolytica TaxID=152573 RepID=A0A1H4B9R4_ALKAM|nr:flagellar hook assembly protein FlgD [Alkalimonas amylolytica]SEA44945.1 flagellar basal-body rod modification protein FlgD [Alkalimonas amylolytica]